MLFGKSEHHYLRLFCVGAALVASTGMVAVSGQGRSANRHPRSRTGDAQGALSPELKQQLIALRDAALADDYAYKQVAHITENIGPRPSGSAQSKAAVDYVANALRELGLEVQLEEVKVPHWVRGVESAEL